MKAVLEFNLPEEKFQFDNACKADEMLLVLRSLENFLFHEINSVDGKTKKETMRLEMVREQFHDYLRENEIPIS